MTVVASCGSSRHQLILSSIWSPADIFTITRSSPRAATAVRALHHLTRLFWQRYDVLRVCYLLQPETFYRYLTQYNTIRSTGGRLFLLFLLSSDRCFFSSPFFTRSATIVLRVFNWPFVLRNVWKCFFFRQKWNFSIEPVCFSIPRETMSRQNLANS